MNDTSGDRQRLDGRTVIITGSAGGIGRATAIRLAAAGASVVCSDIDLDGASETARMAEDAGGKAVGHRCDVSLEKDAADAVAEALSRYGSLWGLVNNAARFVPYKSVVDLELDDWKRSLDVNLSGPFLMSKYAIPAMRRGGGGSIVHVASQLGQVAKAGGCWYGSAKAALIQLAKIMAMDHVSDSIRVNTISPGPIGTDRIHARYGGAEEAERESGGLTLMQRLGKPDEIAEGILFLLSDASSYMTGADLLIDGGYTAQ